MEQAQNKSSAIKNYLPREITSHFRVFHELMAVKIREVLLVSSRYDAFLLEEDGSLASRIINEYSGLNLSQPPRVTRTASARKALSLLEEKEFDMVLTMPHLDDMDAFSLSREIKKARPGLPVHLLTHSTRGIYPTPENRSDKGIDRTYIWSGNSDLLLALIKNAEDRLNVDQDTKKAQVRVLILVEDSPVYYSLLLPLFYKEIVKQTQAVLEAGLNEEHRLLTMRARPKILLATNYNDAVALCEKYREYLFGVISDTRLPMEGTLKDDAGYLLLSKIRKEIPDLPLLLMSSDAKNRKIADLIPAVFLDKNTLHLIEEIRDFFLAHLGFGDFVFRDPQGHEIDRASNLRSLEEKLAHIPDDSLWYHAKRNNFSNWIMARSEIALASTFREVKASEFCNADEMRDYIIHNIHTLRKWRQKGVVAQFKPQHYDPDVMDFVKIGQGSLGGKARSLAFMSELLHEYGEIQLRHPDIRIDIPKTMVICTDGFESFVHQNDLQKYAREGVLDEEVTKAFLRAEMPEWLIQELESFLRFVEHPLSVRSSSLLEDAQFQPYAGLYRTYMIPNNHADPAVRLDHLITAVKLVYASTYYEGPKAFARSTSTQPQEEAMAVVVQQLTGRASGDFFYPALSGVAQSHNFYPVSPMKPEDGIVHIALGLGKTVVEGEKSLRFCPKYPQTLPQFSSVDDILSNSQRYFYALRIRNYPIDLNFFKNTNLEKRDLDDAETEKPVLALSSTYHPDEHRIRDTSTGPGPKVLTFAPVLKYGTFPLPEMIGDLIDLGRKSMGCPVEIEFSVNLGTDGDEGIEFNFLQMRPMGAYEARFEIEITPRDLDRAFCRSTQALGNGINRKIADIVYVKPDAFKPEATIQIAEEIGRINGGLLRESRPYLLIGPGRWGSADRWLGIPVQWKDISGVGAIIELRNENLKADASQGTHFFQNITSLGIHYITVTEGTDDYLNWQWMTGLSPFQETAYLRHVRLDDKMVLKIDGRNSRCVIIGA